MPNHQVANRETWLAARKALLAKERELTHLRDEIARKRRELPWVKVEKNYLFDTPSGKKPLADLFEGRSQLIVYHFMFKPGWEAGCQNCSYLMDHVDGMLPHLNARDVSFVAIARAPIDQLQPFWKRMGWRFKFASSGGNDFNYDYRVSFTKEQLASGKIIYNYAEMKPPPFEDLPGASVFYKDDRGDVFHTYSTYSRGLDILVGTYMYLDLVPKGRDEDGLKHDMAWVRYHDSYGPGYVVDPNAGYTPPKDVGCPNCP